jgi:vesicle-associated membrane protein 7
VSLQKIPEQDNKCSYIYDKYVFHYQVTDGLTYLCMSDTEFDRPLAFQFLSDIRERFVATYGERAKTAIAFAFNADFARVLQAQMEKYNSERDPKIAKIRQQLGEVKDVMESHIKQQRASTVSCGVNSGHASGLVLASLTFPCVCLPIFPSLADGEHRSCVVAR